MMFKGKMRPSRSLQTRFIAAVVSILALLITLILIVIERRERQAIFEEQRNIGLLVAQNISQLYRRPLFIMGDREEVQKNVSAQVNENLLYVVFYDRTGAALIAESYSDEFSPPGGEPSALPDQMDAGPIFSQRRFPGPESGGVVHVLEIETPIFIEGSSRRWGAIKIGHSLEEMYRENRQTRLMLVLTGMVGIFFGVIGALILAARITGPLKQLVDGTIRISKGDFSHRIDIDSRDEIGDLALSFNEMSHKLQLTRRRMEDAGKKLIQAEKLASIGRISASIAHEIRNPLTSVKLNIQKVLENDALESTERDHLSIAQEGIVQIEKYIKEMLNYTRVTELNLDLFGVDQIVEGSLFMLKDVLQEKGILIERDYPPEPPQVLVDGDKIRQVLINLLQNACEAAESGGLIRISLGVEKGRSGDWARIRISDNGPGIPEKDWENVFEPFFTTKSSGTGLGLANARKIIEHHQGTIRVMKKKEPGTLFEILLPLEKNE